jgi:hypothetical protein
MSRLRSWSGVLPIVAIAVFAVFVGIAIAAAAQAGTLGFDFLAYHQAANRLLAGLPVYDMSFDQAGGFGLFYYPPPFAVAFLPLAPLAPSAAAAVWTVLLLAAFAVGVAIMPVATWVRWLTILLAGLSWPFAYAIKLGQVGPLLFLLFAIGWRWLDRPWAVGVSAAIGGMIKIQPGIVVLWAALTRRGTAVGVAVGVTALAVIIATFVVGIDAWPNYLVMLRNVSAPITTPHNFTPGAVAYQLGAPIEVASILQLGTSVVVVVAIVLATRVVADDASYLVTVVASQLLSPVLWDHYALLLLLPTAWLLNRGASWAVAIPLATSTLLISLAPPAAYPLSFAATLIALLAVGWARRRKATTQRVPVIEPA